MNLVAQSSPTAIPADPQEWTFYLFSVAAASGLTWFLTSRRTVAEIDKLKSEKRKLEADIVKLAGDSLREIQRTREAYSSACQKCKKAAQKLTALMLEKASIPEVLTAREELCDVFSRDTIDAYCAYVEWQALSLKSDSTELKKFIQDDVQPELQRLAGWHRVLNAPVFLLGVKAAPLKIEKRSLRPIYDLKRHFEGNGEAVVEGILKRALEDIHH